MVLVALWFSAAKTTASDKDIVKSRKNLIKEISGITGRMKSTLTGNYLETYKKIATFMKDKENLFILAKGVGLLASNYIATKFMQLTGIHAEAYSSSEFRHGPLSMIDEAEKTPGKLPSPNLL